MTKRKLLYDEGTKKVYSTDYEDQLIFVFNDNLPDTSTKIKGKGALYNAISSQIFEYLGSYNILTHFICKSADTEMQVKNIELLPINVLIYNAAEKALSKKYGFEEGSVLSAPVIEYFYKNDKLKNPMVNETHLGALELVSKEEVSVFNRMITKTNAVLKSFFERRQLLLVELNLNIGRYKGNLYIGNEISPDNCQFWGMNGEDKYDQALYRSSKADADAAYQMIVEKVKEIVS